MSWPAGDADDVSDARAGVGLWLESEFCIEDAPVADEPGVEFRSGSTCWRSEGAVEW